MKERKNWGKIAGLVLHILIGGLLILTGSQKVLGLVPPEALVRYGLGEQARLIGAGAILTALLLLIPRTASLGIMLASSFWAAPSVSTWLTASPTSFKRYCSSYRGPGRTCATPQRSAAFPAPRE